MFIIKTIQDNNMFGFASSRLLIDYVVSIELSTGGPLP